MICNVACRMTIGAVLCLSAFAGGVFISNDRSPPYERHSGEITPANPKPGDVVSVKWDGVWHRDCEGTIHRSTTDSSGTEFRLPSSKARYSKRLNGPIFEFEVPHRAKCGPATYDIEARYACDWIQEYWNIVTKKPNIKYNISCGD